MQLVFTRILAESIPSYRKRALVVVNAYKAIVLTILLLWYSRVWTEISKDFIVSDHGLRTDDLTVLVVSIVYGTTDLSNTIVLELRNMGLTTIAHHTFTFAVSVAFCVMGYGFPMYQCIVWYTMMSVVAVPANAAIALFKIDMLSWKACECIRWHYVVCLLFNWMGQVKLYYAYAHAENAPPPLHWCLMSILIAVWAWDDVVFVLKLREWGQALRPKTVLLLNPIYNTRISM
jgi:hypothetical protein